MVGPTPTPTPTPTPRATIRVTNVPRTATASALLAYFTTAVGPVFALRISTFYPTWKSLGTALVQFHSLRSAASALALSAQRLLVFNLTPLTAHPSYADVIARSPDDEGLRWGEGAAVRFGDMVGEREMEVVEERRSGVGVEVVRERGGMVVVGVEDGDKCYKLEVGFGDVVRSLGCQLRLGSGGEDAAAVVLQVKYAPKIYQRMRGPSLKSKSNNDRYNYCKEDCQFVWVRSLDFSANCVIGRSCYICLELPDGISSEILKSLPFFEELGDLILTHPEQSYPASNLVPIVNCPSECPVPYEVLFQLNSLVHTQKIPFRHVNFDLFNILSGLSLDIALQILMKMHKLNTVCYNPVEFVQDHLSILREQKILPYYKIIHHRNLMSCHRAIVTPSRVYFLGPELESCNYVVNHFFQYANDFLRVVFLDEDRNRLRPNAISTKIEQDIFSKPYRTGIYNRILSILRDGISIGSKKFEFLAFSASQLRDSAVWMFASNESVTAQSIREWMGQFGDIYSVSKCAARMGQLFSSSSQTLNVPSHEVSVIPDIETINDGTKYCFSDGIGKISFSFARQVAQKFGLSHTPSAFQIRYGGYKGIIAVDRTSYRKLSLRPSMLKFKSNNTMLNITKCSESQPCYLNREIICLLSTLGVKDEIFELLQKDHMLLLDFMLTNKEVALKVLGKMSGSEVRTIVKMLKHGYEPNSEPYISMLLKSYREFQLSDVRTRFRIFVPKGRVLVGCLDELGTLEYGQVFMRVTLTEEEMQSTNQACFKKVENSTAVIVGKVVVTKNPCLHPGDVRVLEAIFQPQLDNKMGLVDCLVFPQKGPRPHPNECSGGDLDGDLYFVCWDERLIPPEIDEPMDYTARRPRIMDHKVTIEEIHKFFVNYMINDNLGAISDAHLVHADSEPNKARSCNCLQLAKLHSMAVDYAKTGAPAEMPNILRPKKFPDFMERLEKPTYKSTGVMGKLYRAASSYAENFQNSTNITFEEIPYDSDLEVDGFEDFLGIAQEHYNKYADRLSYLIKYYELWYEDEILTGYIRRPQMYLRDRRWLGDMKDRMSIAVKALYREAEAWVGSCSENELPKMAAAWYYVTYHPDYSKSGPKFLSFPWILCDVLMKTKASKGMTN